MNVEIEAETALFPEKEYIKGIFVAVHDDLPVHVPVWRPARPLCPALPAPGPAPGSTAELARRLLPA